MPPRHVYWTIIFGNQPTAFRAATREELLPTLKQIQARHPDAVLMWFARGRLWQSEEEAREALIRQRMERDRKRAPAGGDRARPRGRDWRPGGQHKDPRDRFKVPRDVKRARFKARRRWEPDPGSGTRDAGNRKPDAGGRKPAPGGWKPRPPRPPFKRPFKKKDEE
jgi:hypothetical protein